MMDKLPHYELKRVYEDGSEESPEIVPLLQLPGTTQMNRRGFFGAITAVASVLGMVSCARIIRPDGTELTIQPENSGQKVEGMCSEEILAHSGNVKHLSFSPDGKWMASGSSDGNIKLWQIPTMEHVVTIDEGTSQAFSFSPNGRWLFHGQQYLRKMPSDYQAANSGGYLFSSDKADSIFPMITKIGINSSVVRSATFSPDSKLLAIGTAGNAISIFKIPFGVRISEKYRNEPPFYYAHTSNVNTLSFSPDGKWLVSGSADNSIMIWRMSQKNMGNFTLKTILHGHTQEIFSVAISPDGRVLASGSADLTIKLWAMPMGNAPGKLLANLMGHKGDVRSVAFSPDGKLIASGSTDATIKLWELTSEKAPCKLLTTMIGHAHEINAVSFSSDGKWISSGSSEGTIKIWEAPSGKFVTCLFDPAAMKEGVEAVQYKGVNEYGQIISYSGPCGTSIPPGFSCTCNCVPGTYSPPVPSNNGLPYGYHCTCNQVCTCIPVCQAHKVLDPDPVIRTMAEESLLLMGENEFNYMFWAASTADDMVANRIDEIIESIHQGAQPNPSRWPDSVQCLERLNHTDPVVALMAAQFLDWGAAHCREVLSPEIRVKIAYVIDKGLKSSKETREKVGRFYEQSVI